MDISWSRAWNNFESSSNCWRRNGSLWKSASRKYVYRWIQKDVRGEAIFSLQNSQARGSDYNRTCCRIRRRRTASTIPWCQRPFHYDAVQHDWWRLVFKKHIVVQSQEIEGSSWLFILERLARPRFHFSVTRWKNGQWLLRWCCRLDFRLKQEDFNYLKATGLEFCKIYCGIR